MKSIWLILAGLTLARMTMGFQFQSMASVGPTLTSAGVISFTELGVLIGIYLLPGVLFAIPGGWLGKRFGDKSVVLFGLALMTFGGAMLAFSESYALMFTGRLLAGLGAVLLNVLASKMVTDWFVGHRITTAMGILISSWPLGIALALLTLPLLQQGVGLELALLVPALNCFIALLLVAFVYQSPASSEAASSAAATPLTAGLSAREFWAVMLCGGVWCLYNVAFILPLSFAPDYLVQQGLDIGLASATVSLTSWLIIPALPLGALLAERIGRPLVTMMVSFLAILVLLWILPYSNFYLLIFALLGLVFGPAGGLIMALPSQVLQPQNRAIGMGVFFTVYYAGMGVFPALAGYLRDLTGNPLAPLVLAGIAILLAMFSLAGFQGVKAGMDYQTRSA